MMFLSEVTFDRVTYKIEFVDIAPRSIIVGKTLKVHKGATISDKLRNYVTALLMCAQGNKTNVPSRVDLDVACKVIEMLIAPADTHLAARPKDYEGTGYQDLGDGLTVIRRDGA